MSDAFLLLHGYGNHRPPEHWQHWLKDELTRAGATVIYPQLPNPEAPVLAEWLAALDEHLATLMATRARERIVICHSLSCLLWLHGAAALSPELRPDRLVLVSPPADAQVPEPAAGFRLERIDAGAVSASVSGEIRIVCSDDDPYNPGGGDAVYATPLGVPCDILPGGGHISADDGFGPWPAVRAWCEQPGGPLPVSPAGPPR